MTIEYKYTNPQRLLEDSGVLTGVSNPSGPPSEVVNVLTHVTDVVKNLIKYRRDDDSGDIDKFKKVLFNAALHNSKDGKEFKTLKKVITSSALVSPGSTESFSTEYNEELVTSEIPFTDVDVKNVINALVDRLMASEGITGMSEEGDPPPIRLDGEPLSKEEEAYFKDMPDFSDAETIARIQAKKDKERSRAQKVQKEQINLVRQRLEKVEGNTKFDEQCFMMAYLNNYASNYRTRTYEEAPLRNVLVAETNSSSPIINSFSNYVDLKPLHNLTTEKLSFLYPKIELHKVYVRKTPKGFTSERSKPFIFETSENRNDIENILMSNSGRGNGVGIKSFSWKYTGDNPATVQRLITAELQIYIQDLSYFMKSFPSAMNRADYTDLFSRGAAAGSSATPTAKKTRPCDLVEDEALTTQINELEQTEIEARVGWNILDNDKQAKEFFTTEELTALRESVTVLRLGMKEYDFRFQQDGTVILSLSYIGRVEGLMETNRANLFIETNMEKEKRKNAEAQVSAYIQEADNRLAPRQQSLRAQLKRAQTPQERNQIQVELNKLNVDGAREMQNIRSGQTSQLMAEYREIRKERFEAILRNIELSDRIYFLRLDLATISSCIEGKKGANYTFLATSQKPPEPFTPTDIADYREAVKKKMEAHRKKRKNNAKKNKNKPKGVTETSAAKFDVLESDKYYIFPFIYVGDILESAAKILDSNMSQKDTRYRIVTSSFVYRDLNCKRKVVNIADIPISLNAFTNWYTDSFTSKMPNSLPFIRFVKKLMSDLVIKAVGKACFNDVGNNYKAGSTKLNVITVSDKLDKLLVEKKRFKIDEILNDRNNPKDTVPGNNYEYLILSCDLYPMNFTGDKKTDEAKGIMHMHLGRDRGLIKEIEFSKNSIPGFRESFITGGSILDKLRLPFDTSITMYGYPFIIPGCRFYVDPTFSGMGDTSSPNSVARKLGLGGYYIATAVENTISDGLFITEINGIFDSFPKEAPIIKQEEANVFKPSLRADKVPANLLPEGATPSAEVLNQLDVEIGNAIPASGNVSLEEARRVKKREAVIDKLLQNTDGSRSGLSNEELSALEERANRLIENNQVAITFEEGTNNILEVRFVSPNSDSAGVFESPGLQMSRAERLQSYIEKFVNEGASLEEATRLAEEKVNAEDGGSPEDTEEVDPANIDFDSLPVGQGNTNNVTAERRYLNRIIKSSSTSSAEEEALSREIVNYYEISNNIVPRTYPMSGRTEAERVLMEQAYEEVFSAVALDESGDSLAVQATVVFPEGRQRKSVPYTPAAERVRSKMLVVNITVENDLNSNNLVGRFSLAGSAKAIKPYHSADNRERVFGSTSNQVVTAIKTNIEEYYSSEEGVVYEYNITENYSTFNTQTRDIEINDIATLNRNIDDAFIDSQSAHALLLNSQFGNSIYEYENNIQLLLDAEDILKNLQQQRERAQNGFISGRYAFDAEQREQQLRTRYPYVGPRGGVRR